MRVLTVILLVASAQIAGAGQEWRTPAVESEPAQLGADACGCSRALRACLIGASLSLGRCLVQARSPARQALCYLKFELDAFLCVEQAAVCRLTCVA